MRACPPRGARIGVQRTSAAAGHGHSRKRLLGTREKPGRFIQRISGEPLKTQFRLDINALRALAVVMVIANHLDNRLFPGGYLGVDIFFAISGFVIYQSIYSRSLAAGSFDMAGFYARRILRLFPALMFLVLAVSLLVVCFDPDPANSIKTGLFSIFGLSNLYLYQQDVDYFAPSIAANAFMHTWSLGVEEQFYVLLSLLIALFAWLKAGRNTLLFAVIGGASFAYWLYLTVKGDIASAYFFSPARFWEVMAGVVVARVCIARTFVANRLVFHAVLAGLVALTFAPDALDLLFKPLAIAMTCVVLATGSAYDSSRVLGFRPLQFLGDVSYSLYLWHWPVICLSVYVFGFGSVSAGWLLAAMLAAAVFSYYVVERPFRKYDYRTRLARVFVATLVVGAAGYFAVHALGRQSERLLVKSDVQYTFPASAEPYGERRISFFGNCAIDGVKRLLKEDTVSTCTLPPRAAGKATFWLEGDSHAGHHNAGINVLREKYGYGVHAIETVGMPFPTVSSASRLAIHREIMQKARPGDVIVIARLFFDRPKMSPARDLEEWTRLVDSFAATARSRGIRIVILGPLPVFEFTNIRTCRSRGLHHSSCDVDRSKLEQVIAPINARLAALANRHQDVKFVDQFDILCPPVGTSCSPFEQGVSMYRDKDHLSSRGSRKVFESIAEELRDFPAKGSAKGAYRVRAIAGTPVAAAPPTVVAAAPVARPARPDALKPDQVSTLIVLDGEPRIDAQKRVIEIPVKIHNRGSARLSGTLVPPVNVGVQILASDGSYTSAGGLRDFARFPLPVIEPGASASMVLPVPMKAQANGHTLRVDLVQEGISWFSRWGLPTLEVGPFEFKPDTDAAPPVPPAR